MQQKHCPNSQKTPTLRCFDESNASSNNFLLTRQNCMTVSNESESLLVSSLRATSSHGQGSNIKRQKRLNSQFLMNQRNRLRNSRHSEVEANQNVKMHMKQAIQQTLNSQNNRRTEQIKSCLSCTQQTLQMKQRLQRNIHKVEELQALIKICFSKHISLESIIREKDKQIQLIKARLDESQRILKKNQQMLVKQSVNRGLEAQNIKVNIVKLNQKISQKTKQINQVIQLEKNILQQKMSKISTFYEQKFDSLIEMVQQVTKIQDKMMRAYKQKQNSTNLSNINLNNTHQATQINMSKRHFFPINNKMRQPSFDKTRNQQKSKIAYYLSKSNFNDTTTFEDTTITQLSRIGI